jgi:transcription initiation factor IIE alpha subunit
MQLALLSNLIGMSVDRILAEILPKETGAARLQQIGLFTLIFVLEQRGEKVTVARIRKLTRQSQSAIYKQLEKLVDAKIIKRTMTKTDRRPWFVYELSINYDGKAKRLIKAMGGSAEPSAVRGTKRR